MPKSVLQFRVVIASPSDVFAERKSVFEAIRELDRTLDVNNIAVKAVGWEEYASPGIATEAQELINNQILPESDIVIAIFGHRLGSPTINHRSGTIEEIEKIINNAEHPMGDHRLHVYFLDKIESISSIDPKDLLETINFRNKLESRGIFYRTFRSSLELEQEVRVNIQRAINSYNHHSRSIAIIATTQNSVTTIESDSTDIEIISPDDTDVGILDIAEAYEESTVSALSSVTTMSQLIQDIAQETKKRAIQMESLAHPAFLRT